MHPHIVAVGTSCGGGTSPSPARRPRRNQFTPLSTLTDDAWAALAAHLDLSSVHALALTSQSCNSLVRRMFPAITLHFNATNRREAIARAIATDDPSLAAFALAVRTRDGHLQPNERHPLLSSYMPERLCPPDDRKNCACFSNDVVPSFAVSDDTAVSGIGHSQQQHQNAQQSPSSAKCRECKHSHVPVSLAVARVLRKGFIGAGGAVEGTVAPHLLCRCENDDVVLYMVRQAVSERVEEEHLQHLLVNLAYRSRGDLVNCILREHPWLACSRGVCPRCESCSGQHGLLHAAAETGTVSIVRAVSVAMGPGNCSLVPLLDCAGESALSIALTFRETRVAQELVRHGAQTRELVGCAARGGGRLQANQVWYKEELDVD